MENGMERLSHKWAIEPLRDFSILKDFDCGIETMNKFIRNGFQLSVENHFCEAYAVTAEHDLVGIFALSFDSIDLDSDDKEELQQGVSTASKPMMDYNYEEIFYSKRRYPALDIAYLAIQEKWRGQNIGKAIVSEIAEKTKRQHFAGCQFITVEAYSTHDYSAVGFYHSCGFAASEIKNPNKDTLRMFMPLYTKE